MFDFLSVITKGKYWILHSLIIRAVLKCYGISVGKQFFIKGVPKLKIRGKAENIVIGDNVSILGDIDIRNRENGRLIIDNGVIIEQDCRFVAARDGDIIIGKNTVVGAFAVFNGGADIKIGKKWDRP